MTTTLLMEGRQLHPKTASCSDTTAGLSPQSIILGENAVKLGSGGTKSYNRQLKERIRLCMPHILDEPLC